MRIVDLNKLSEEERKKVLEEQQTNLKQRQQESSELQRQANQKFNEIVSKKGEYTPSRTTTIRNLEKAYQNNNTVKKSLNNYYNNNKTSLWNQMQNLIHNKNIETNQSKMLKMSNNISYKEAVLNAKNKIDTSKIKEEKRNDMLTNKANKNILFSERVKILPTTINQDELIDNLANMNRTESQKQIRTITNSEEERKNLTLQVEDYRQTLKSQKEAEKINEDLKNGKYGSSIAHVLKGIPEEALNATIKTTATLSSLLPETIKGQSDDMLNASKVMTNNYQEKTSMIDNDIVKTASNVSGTVGQMIPSILANLAAPGSGGVVNAVNVGSSNYIDTLNENNSNKAQALLTGGTKGLASYGIERLTGGNFLSKTGSLDDLAKQTISSKLSSNLSKRVASKIYEFGGEVIEEQLENQVGYVIDKVINNKEITAEEWKNDFNETTKNTILTTLVLNMLGLGGNTYNEIKNQEADVKAKKVIEEAEKIIRNENLHVNSQQNTTINQNNQSTQQTIQEINKMAQNGNMEQINNNLANNQESLYNSSKERESDLNVINRGTQETDLERDFSESRVLEERKQITEQNYREWEQSIKSKQDSELTYEEQQLKKEIKATQNKDIVFIKEDNGKGYYAGASLDNANIIYIKTEEANKFGLNRTALHETMESNIRFSDASTQDIIMSTIDDMVNDYSFEKQKEEFWKDQDGDMPSDTAIAKDIICDRLAELNGETLDYENVLSDEIKNRIDMSIEYFKKELGNTSSFNLPTKADVKSKVNLPTKENIKKDNLLYDIDEGIIKELPTSTRLQSSEGLNSLDESSSFINNSIPQNKNSVKDNTITNNYAQNNENNTQNEVNLPTRADVKKKVNLPTKENINQPTQGEKIDGNTIEKPEGKMRNTKRTLNPTEISNLSVEDANTTPILSEKNYEKGNKQSSFFSNIVTEAKFLENDLRQEIGKNENIRYYKGITNEETLEKAYKSLNEEGKNATLNWFNKDSKDISAEDVAKGWILLKQYQDVGDYQSAVEVAKKMRDMGTKAGQAVQAYNILSRLTPEGMFYYAQSELNEAYNKMVEGKSKKWIEENRDKFDLTPEETKFIMENMNEVANMEDGYDKKVKIAEIQKIISDKIPPTIGQSIKSWMRISMLFNLKTQVRNIVGNAVILPVNIGSDIISSGIDKVISKKTGVRTTGNINPKNYAKGFGKGLYESYNDFRKGINTRNIEGNKFEVNEGKNFKDNGIGKSLNIVDNLLSFTLDAGDRGFYEATFTNSINNQLVLNNTTEVTQEMIEIATNEALQRTWQDNNSYTSSVLAIRNILNGKIDFGGIHTKGLNYGLGDILIPFAKTPANLTKAIIDYSPAGLVKAMTLDARTFKNSLENGQFTPQIQHKFVQNLGKGMAGTFLYVIGYALAKAGFATGEADDDKDVKNFMKNSLGISSYSIKIGDKTFKYDWAQPVATPLAIMSNYVKYSEENQNANIIEKGIKSLNIGTEQLLKQSFMESLNTVLNGNGTTLENLSQAVLELPARAIPTFSKQIADMVDGTQRTSFEYDKPLKSAVNSVVVNIPFASKTLPVSRDTLGNEVKKYGGENNFWNVMLNPANVNKGELSKAGEEVYRLYQETGDTKVFPVTAPYYINSKGQKITMTAEKRSEYQKVTGEYTEKAIEELVSNSSYKNLSDEKKTELITDIISDSNAKAKHDILGIETEEAKKKRELIEKIGTKNYYDYRLKTKDIKGEGASKQKIEVLANSNYSAKAKEIIYKNTEGSKDKKIILVDKLGLPINEYLKYKSQTFENDKDENEETIKGSKKEKVYNYLNDIYDNDLSQDYKKIICKIEDINTYDKDIVNFVTNYPGLTGEEHKELLEIIGFNVDKDGYIKTTTMLPIKKYIKR